MHPTLLFHPGALLSQSELSSARIDGLLIEVGDGYMPPDLPEDAAARVASLRPILIAGYAVSGPTAAWVYGCGDAAPRCHHLQRATERRARVQPLRNVVVHENQLAADEIEMIAGFRVTTRMRTLSDLVRNAHSDPEAALWMHRMASVEPALVPKVRAALAARQRMPGKRAALAALDELLAVQPRAVSPQEEVTR